MKWVFASELNEQPEFGADQLAAFAQLASLLFLCQMLKDRH